MENGETGAPLASGVPPGGTRARSHRSAVTNGTRLFALTGIDGRTPTARRYRDIIDEVSADLGGADLLSEAQRQLIKRGSALSTICEGAEQDLARDLPFDVGTYVTAVNALNRVFGALGIERR